VKYVSALVSAIFVQLNSWGNL